MFMGHLHYSGDKKQNSSAGPETDVGLRIFSVCSAHWSVYAPKENVSAVCDRLHRSSASTVKIMCHTCVCPLVINGSDGIKKHYKDQCKKSWRVPGIESLVCFVPLEVVCWPIVIHVHLNTVPNSQTRGEQKYRMLCSEMRSARTSAVLHLKDERHSKMPKFTFWTNETGGLKEEQKQHLTVSSWTEVVACVGHPSPAASTWKSAQRYAPAMDDHL